MTSFFEWAGYWVTLGCLVWAFEEYVLYACEQGALNQTFNAWWLTVRGMEARAFAVALAAVCVAFLNRVLGPGIFSIRSVVISTMLGAIFLLTFLAGALTVGVHFTPFKNYNDSMQEMLKMADQPIRENQTQEMRQADEQLKGTLREVVATFNTRFWKCCYVAFFVVALVLSNSVVFFLSVIFARLLLGEIAATGRFLSVGALLIVETQFLLFISTLYLVFIGILSFPAMWIAVPAGYYLGSSGAAGLVITGFVVGLAGGVIWFVGSPVLKLAVLIAFGPSVFAIFVSLASAIIIANRNFLHWAMTQFLKRAEGSSRPLTATITIVSIVALGCQFFWLLVFHS